MHNAVAMHYGLDPSLRIVEHGTVGLAGAIDVARAVYRRRRASYETGKEALSDTSFGFSRAADDFIELCVNGSGDISMTVELPMRTGWGFFKNVLQEERSVGSLAEVKAWLERYLTPSHDALRIALRSPI